MSESEAESQDEQDELERRIGWFGSHCGCQGHVIMRTKHLREMRAGAPPTPERVFVKAAPRDPNEPAHTHQYASSPSAVLRAAVECPGCIWQAEQAAAHFVEHPEERPEWLLRVEEILRRGPDAPKS